MAFLFVADVNGGFPAYELSKVKGIVMTHEPIFMEAWDEFFDA